MVIAIDGPAGAGKSTIAKILAKKLGFLYIDTGAMYRALTLKALETGVPIEDPEKLFAMARRTVIDLRPLPDGSLAVHMDGRDVSKEIRELRVSARVSDVAKVREVREVLVELQRRLGARADAVLDGRDIGSHVFPDAAYKFYLDADVRERAMRRFKELTAAGTQTSLEAVEADVKNRDRIDSSREFAPLCRAKDAQYVDTTSLNIEQVVEVLLRRITDSKDRNG